MLIGGPLVLTFFALPIIGIVLGIITAVEVGRYPEWAFAQNGASKAVWQILPVVLGFLCFGVGAIVMYAIWVSSKRSAVQAAAAQGPYGGAGYGYGAPPPGWTPPGRPGGWTPPSQPPPPMPPPGPPQ